MTEEAWWELAVEKPLEAMAHPLWALLLLADLDRWLALERRNQTKWIDGHVGLLSPARRDQYREECANRAPNRGAATATIRSKSSKTLCLILWQVAMSIADMNMVFEDPTDNWNTIFRNERVWQWRRLVELLKEQETSIEASSL